MSLSHILLGMLDQPASGYALKQSFSRSLRHFWYADLAQIYPSLHKLEQRGQVSSVKVPSDKGPQQRVYERTAAGTQALREWVTADPITGRERFPYLAQIMFLGDNGSAEQQLEYFIKLTNYFESKVAALNAINASWQEERRPEHFADGELFHWFTLDLGIARNKATLDWCRQSLKLLQRRSADP